MTERCRFCGREASHRIFICMNTRDMEEWALMGFEVCYHALAVVGGGERGMARMDALILERRQRDATAAEARELDLP
jgi:hypothetical protein